ncbi:YihY family inner membrane protein [Haladaptatus litoreus]|uniref:YihY family inner membrane protein n=1 Tax=Haladaptatus litoreus TaxID=553468 RepID=A0A1N7BDU0_9EURY|nr:YihY/virulence factor BrkB family protein [Haladaptatus litoreus]SIR49475.1 YihY family inner membrane protein [Haladaptatus litoreus]
MNFRVTTREIAAEVREQEITFLAAGIAFYAFVSILPALLLGLAVVSIVGGERIATEVVMTAQQFLSPAAEAVIYEAFTSRSGRSSATIVGVLVLVWSTLRVFRGLDKAFSRVYDSNHEESFFETLVDASIVVVVIALALLGLALGSVVFSAFSWVPFAKPLSSVVVLFALAPVFLPLYYFFPDADVTVREALPGTILATVSWVALQALFQAYVESAAQFAAYGVLGGALLLVSWLYLGAIVLLLGAVVNAVLAGGSFRKTKDAGATNSKQQVDSGEYMTDDTEQSAPDILELHGDVERLQSEFEEFEQDVDERTVQKPKLESELKRYVRRRMRRGHARGWGPYLVLLYGTVMTLGAFRWLESGWAIAAMLVIWLSTLGLYTLMVLVGFGVSAVGVPGRVGGRIRDWRS